MSHAKITWVYNPSHIKPIITQKTVLKQSLILYSLHKLKWYCKCFVKKGIKLVSQCNFQNVVGENL